MGAPDPDPEVPTPRRRPSRRAAVVGALAVVVVAVVAGGVAVAGRDAPEVATTVATTVGAGTGGGDVDLAGEWGPTTTATTTTTTLPAVAVEDGLALAPPLERPWADSFTVADAVGPSIPLYAEPDVPVPSGRALENPTWEGLAVTFLVRERRPGWVRGQIMARPNTAMAWVRASDVTLRTVPHHIVIERGARRLTLYRGEEVLLQTAVATGKDSSPTPLGTFFVDGVVPLSPPHPAYGTGQLSFTGFSEVYSSFGGGVGQVAVHGTQDPALIGTPASNGCVRMRNEDIERLMGMAPTGTPVEVVA